VFGAPPVPGRTQFPRLFVNPERQSKSQVVPVHFAKPFAGALQPVHPVGPHPTAGPGLTQTPPQSFSPDPQPLPPVPGWPPVGVPPRPPFATPPAPRPPEPPF
jgi:hypothetical protein